MKTSLVARKQRKSKKKPQLEGIIQSGVLFIGDPIYMGANPQDFPGGVIPEDSCNPFHDYSEYLAKNGGVDENLLLPDSYRDHPIGRGCAVQLQQVSGRYVIKKKVDKVTGKVKSITIKLYE